MNTDSINKILRQNLTSKRYAHVQGVIKTARELSYRYCEDAYKAECAALFHDMYKCITLKESDSFIRKLGLDEKYIGNPNLAHAKIAAEKMQKDFGVSDKNIINAVSYHTTARPEMSCLEKIIYVADAIEPSRQYDGIEELRKVAKMDLDRATLLITKNTFESVKKRGFSPDSDTEHAIEYYEQYIREKECFYER